MKVRQNNTTTNASNMRGIHRHTNTGKYEARFNFGSQRVYIGSYNTVGDAVMARVKYITNLI
jgi:hypothetical protein